MGSMNLKCVLRLKIFHGAIMRRVLLRALLIASALSIVPLLQIISGVGILNGANGDDCAMRLAFLGPFMFPGSKSLSTRFLKPVWGSFESVQCKENVNLTANVVKQLMSMQLLNSDANALCIGQGSASAVLALRELGFPNARGDFGHHIFSLMQKKYIYELDYEDKSFDFIFSRDLDDVVVVPALLVVEMERVLKPGGVGAILVSTTGLSSNSLIRSATPISSLLKDSSVVHVDRVDEFTLVVFKRKVENAVYFEQTHLPADCQAMNGKPYIDLLEPLVEEKPADFEKRIAYLPKFVDISSRNRLVYIDIGAAEHLNASESEKNWFLPSYPVDSKAFNVYFVDHNTSVMVSYVKKPGITFVYHPGLAANKDRTVLEELNPYVEDDSFDFVAWFKETVQFADFVLLKMNAKEVEMNFLLELFNSGTICFVDELMLNCSGRSDCMEIFKGLRSKGVFVHQWWGD